MRDYINEHSVIIKEVPTLPKVREEYFEAKKAKILDAAYRVAMKKPVHEVSMRDIITESGYSQGGIYRYFRNLDEVLIELINSRYVPCGVSERADLIIASDACPEVKIGKLFSLWKKAFLDNLMGVGKIYNELTPLYANDPDRLNTFLSRSTLTHEQMIFQRKSFSYIFGKISDGYFHPKLPPDEIVKLLITSIDGITRDLILTQHYKMNSNMPVFDAIDGFSLMYSLCISFVLLLGGNDTYITKEIFTDANDSVEQ